MAAPTASRAEIVDRIRSAESPPMVLSALSAYIGSLPSVDAIPEWCLRLPLNGADDRAAHGGDGRRGRPDSQTLRDRECGIAKAHCRPCRRDWRLRWREGSTLHSGGPGRS
jgi:hypothetical protein